MGLVGDEIVLPQTSKAEIELQEPMMRYLAQLRKQGMDLLFPRSCMDTVLSAIWIAVSAQGALPLAHRELIDIVIFAKENGTLADVDAVSKTKVRGILALLKHGEILDGKQTNTHTHVLRKNGLLPSLLLLSFSHLSTLCILLDPYSL